MGIVDLREYPDFSLQPGLDDVLHAAAERGGPLPSGQYALAWSKASAVYLARDPLGCIKLFYGYRPDGRLLVANRIDRLAREGVGANKVWSCPPGRILKLEAGSVRVVAGDDISAQNLSGRFEMADFKRKVADTLAQAMNALAQRYPAARFAVCLSGGLDSSVVAELAKRHLPDVTAFSFSFLAEREAAQWLEGKEPGVLHGVSEDFGRALGVARALELPLVPVFRAPAAVAAAIEPAVRLGQDYRDFNVHCAVVNLFLAQEIRAWFPGETVVVLTGDLMNEYVCDYHEEKIGDVTYYPQPRMPLVQRRRFYVRGLDAGDREVGVFDAFGLNAIQLFHCVAEHYMTVPESFLEQADAKWTLNADLLSPKIRDKVGLAKQRAQVGGSDGGVLGVFHRLGIGQEHLLALWARSFPAAWRRDDVKQLIQVGRYRTAPLEP